MYTVAVIVQDGAEPFGLGSLVEVWGEDYIGGSRTVDVHIRRLRAKLGADHEHLITTVRNVGYSYTAGRDQTP